MQSKVVSIVSMASHGNLKNFFWDILRVWSSAFLSYLFSCDFFCATFFVRIFLAVSVSYTRRSIRVLHQKNFRIKQIE